MKSFALTSLASLLACISALAATDVSGSWSSATMFVILKQEGARISGSGGPTEKQQVLAFDNGTLEGDRIAFQAGSFQFNLQLTGDELKGEMRNGPDTTPVFLKRVTERPGRRPPILRRSIRQTLASAHWHGHQLFGETRSGAPHLHQRQPQKVDLRILAIRNWQNE